MLRCLYFVGLLLVANLIVAQETGTTRGFHLVDWCEPHTMLAGRISLKNLDVRGAIDEVTKSLPQNDPAQTSTIMAAKVLGASITQSLADSGVSDIYMTWSSLDLIESNESPQYIPAPVLWLATTDPKRSASVVNVFVSQFQAKANYMTKAIDNAVILGTPASIARIEKNRVDSRTDLTQPLDSPEDWTVIIQASLPTRTKEEIAEVWPAHLPAPLEFVSPNQLMHNIRNLTFRSRLNQEIAFQLTAICVSPPAAQSAYQTLESSKSLMPPEFPKLAVSIDDTRLEVKVTHNEFSESLFNAFGAIKTANTASAEINNLHQIMLAIHSFAASYSFLPPRETRLPDGKPLLSWRVHLLPFLGEQSLYQQFHLDEPWDSEHNKQLIAKIPSVYVTDLAIAERGLTQIAAPVILGSLWAGDSKPFEFKAITDGTSRTIAAWIAPPNTAVIWTQPIEPVLEETNLMKQFFGESPNTTVGFLDGSVRTVSHDTEPSTLKAAITINGGELVDL